MNANPVSLDTIDELEAGIRRLEEVEERILTIIRRLRKRDGDFTADRRVAVLRYRLTKIDHDLADLKTMRGDYWAEQPLRCRMALWARNEY